MKWNEWKVRSILTLDGFACLYWVMLYFVVFFCPTFDLRASVEVEVERWVYILLDFYRVIPLLVGMSIWTIVRCWDYWSRDNLRWWQTLIFALFSLQSAFILIVSVPTSLFLIRKLFSSSPHGCLMEISDVVSVLLFWPLTIIMFSYRSKIFDGCECDKVGSLRKRLSPKEKLEAAAKQGDANAQKSLGDYYKGEGAEQSYEEAAKWYLKAAEQGNADAQLRLGHCYYEGEGVEQSYEEAVKWYLKAAEQDNFYAPYVLGKRYYEGEGVEQSYEEAVKWYRRAAAQGHVSAMVNLGVCYERGYGVEQSYEGAVSWYREVGDLSSDALTKLGNCYYYGQGVEQSYEEAVSCYQKAANQRNKVAQHNLAFCYEHGKGVERSLLTANKWYTRAMEGNYVATEDSLPLGKSNA